MLKLKTALPFTLYFLRHAHAISVRPDIESPLSEKGKSQSSILKKEFKGNVWDLVIVSTALRARQTAEIVASSFPFIELSSLYDLLPYAEDISAQAIYSLRDQEWIKDSALALLDKTQKAIIEIIEQHQASSILIVAHSGVINVLASLFAKEHASLLLAYPLQNAEVIILSP